MIFLTVLVFIVLFSVLILVHEWGHFLAAKRAGVKVEEFGFGLPPRLWGIKKGETLYSFNAIPFGGFVRMLGEDATDKKNQSNTRSFSSQSLRTQAIIVCAGVMMNLLLSFVLLTIGFSVGIEPLMSSEEDFLKAVRDGTVHVEVSEESESDKPESEASEFDATETPLLYLPRLVYWEDEDSIFHGVLQDRDVLLRMNDQVILTESDLLQALKGQTVLYPFIYRPGLGELLIYGSKTESGHPADADQPLFLPVQPPLVTYIEPDSPAEQAGFQLNDRILALNGVPISTAEEVSALTLEWAEKGMISYAIQRGAEQVSLSALPRAEDGHVGIGLSDFIPYYGHLSLYEAYVPHKLLGIEKVQYSWQAPWVALTEMGRLAKVTAFSFFGVLKEFVSGGAVPEGVAGPVGIAQMTFVTVQEGFAATLRFVALLSLSLGVINILPIPALDGGKFLFILVQALTGKKLAPRYESLIHAAGFFFFIAFILYVTFHDVIALF